jgi:hypothetical protein
LNFGGGAVAGLEDAAVETEVLHFVQDDKFVGVNREDRGGGYGCDGWGFDGGSG